MNGTIGLIVRIVLLMAGGALGQMGFAEFDPNNGVLSIDIDALSTIVSGLVSVGIALAWRVIAKRKGGVT